MLLIGAGQAGVLAARELAGRLNLGLEVKGFVDDDPQKAGALIQGFKVLGATGDLPALVKEHDIDHVIVTIARTSRENIGRIVKIAESVPVKVRIIPGFYEILGGRVEVSRIRDVEIEDLLGRDPVHLQESELGAFLTGKSVMVTGAGGSIGSELARQIARFAPSRLILVDRAEFVLFDIHREILGNFPSLAAVPAVADVGDEARLRVIFALNRPQVVFHAAAHKHVPMMEINPTEAIKNNILATRCLGRIAGEHGAEAVVMISTDKAVRPTSVMGASKRVAELLIPSLSRQFKTRFMAVRFGNVLGSAGSVIPIFREQIRNGGPITVTDAGMVRYFMTIPEASQLVLQAGAMGRGGEVFILDMGEPVRIVDLAEQMITLSGLKPYEDIPIVFTGCRPGEKIIEELHVPEEEVLQTGHPKILAGIIAEFPEDALNRSLERLSELANAGLDRDIRLCLNDLIPGADLAT